jgi:Zn-dependent peptidase ImmA (M78 family)
MKVLGRIAQALCLNEFDLTFKELPGADASLAVRLRSPDSRLKPRGVLSLAEASWVIRQQTEFQVKDNRLKGIEPVAVQNSPEYPPWLDGAYRAQKTRRLLDLGDKPISNLHRLIESLGIPVIQQRMPERIAGATISVNAARGIVANLDGDNKKATVRRFTLAHELGHLLWDPDQHLNSLRVDDFSDMENRIAQGGSFFDPVESRANGFAIDFLLPASKVDELFKKHGAARAMQEMMEEYGVSYTAAGHHLRNVTRFKGELPRIESVDRIWNAAEDPAFFPIRDTPDSRRGKFARCVVEAEKGGRLHARVVASWLGCAMEEYQQKRDQIVALI